MIDATENFALITFFVFKLLNRKNFVYKQKDNRNQYFMLTLVPLTVKFGSE